MNLKELTAEIAEAEEAYDLYQKHLRARADLTAAVATKDRLQLQAALHFAENLDLRIEIMQKAKEILRELEITYRADKASGEECYH
jgi:hypothetical protein